MLTTIGSVIANSIQSASKSNYGASNAKADVEKGKKYDFSTCRFLTNGDYASKKYPRTKDDSSLDRFAQAFPDTFKKGSDMLKKLQGWRAGAQALSHVPHTMFSYGAKYETAKWFGVVFKRVVPEGEGVRGIAMGAALEMKKDAVLKMVGDNDLPNGTILKGMFAPPADEKKRDEFLNLLRVAAGGFYTAELEDLNKTKPEDMNFFIKPSEALIVSAAYYMAAEQLVNKSMCDTTGIVATDQKKYDEYIGKAKVWETIARRAFSPEIALKFEEDVQKFEAANKDVKDPYGKIQRINAHFYGWYESGGNVQFTDGTFTRIHRDTVSPMQCGLDPAGKDADSTFFFSTFRNPIVAMWWQARHGALGCFGEIKAPTGRMRIRVRPEPRVRPSRPRPEGGVFGTQDPTAGRSK